jgi:hypothetical protein
MNYRKTKIYLFIFISMIFGSINQISAQAYTIWTNHIDLSKNGFIDDNHFGVTTKIKVIVNQGEPEFDEGDDENEEEGTKRLPRIYRKSNNKYILIWNDTKEKITKSEYDFIDQMGINTFKVSNDNNIYGIIDTLDQFILPLKYSSIESADPDLYYFEEGEQKNVDNAMFSAKNLPTLFFECIESTKLKTAMPRQIIGRDGKIIFEEKSGNSIGIYYFIKNKQIYHLFESYANNNTSFYVSKLGEKPLIAYEGDFSPPEYSIGKYEFIKDPLICAIERKKLIEFFDFNKMEYIKSIPPFRNFEYISSNYARISNISKADNQTNIKSLISNDLKVIVPFDLGYEQLDPLTQQHYDENELDEKNGSKNQIDNQLSEDSLLSFVKDIKDPKKGNSERMEGLHKIGIGTIVPPIYRYINRMTKNLCIVTFKDDNSQNILSLSTFKLLRPHNYDKIELKQDVDGTSYFECLYEGKKEKFQISTSQ